ncbi:Type I restriction-modification system, restriction subunit R [Vibrio chagasii]|nr:Type I restriction-modification system, restriction subunit R [Vibrio chagasii]CAH6945001.1 Type I restriction-modification system, restriction subunit R [Vibrio chagasii]CAH7091030.1 Type I restriction-modification system, restriction subunit R [Vibrio chagasii]CAH7485602.1 Type I restriction-modification system, restriction subunit R [Vibrio chagasii]
MSLKFTEAKLEQAIIELLGEQGYTHVVGEQVAREDKEQVLIVEDLQAYLTKQYQADDITEGEIDQIVHQLNRLPASDLYESNKTFCNWLANGFLLKREDRSKKDLYIELIDTKHLAQALRLMFVPLLEHKREEGKTKSAEKKVREDEVTYLEHKDQNIYKIVNQLHIENGDEERIPDGILYINGLPLVLFEFKSAVREEQATIYDAWEQIHIRYKRAIPQLFVFNVLTIISDGVNNKMGNAFAPYEFYYAWRKVTGEESTEKQGINSLYTMIGGLFDKVRLLDVVKNFIFFPDTSKKEIKVCCRYPQYYAARKLYYNIDKERKPYGSGKGGTYFGATGCGKSFTMQFLSRLLMKSVDFESPTIVLITDRNDLDDQLSEQFYNASGYIGDEKVISVTSRSDLREQLQGIKSGGVFLTTIHKFTEDIELLSERTNIICISDEAHRSQVNLDKKVTLQYKDGVAVDVKESYGFAKYLRDSLPSATYVGFTGTPIDATLDVFGNPVDSYTMTEAVNDEITVRIVYEGRAARVILDNSKLEEVEKYYQDCAGQGASEHQIEESKKSSANMNSILGDEDRLEALAKDFVAHYEERVAEGSTVKGKAMFVCASREIAYDFYKQVKRLRPEWFEIKKYLEGETLTEQEAKELLPLAMVQMVMTRGSNDEVELYKLLGTKDYRKSLDAQFKNAKSNFKIAIVVDMWLTGFDVPELDTIYIDKPLQKHNLIQTISRVNRKFEGKDKGLVVDYIGIKSRMNQALAMYSKADESNFEDVQLSVVEVKNHLDLLDKMFYNFDSSGYFSGEPRLQLECLNLAAEFVLVNKKNEHRFMGLVKRLKAAYDVCCGSESLTNQERDFIHFYIAVRSIIYKLTKGDAPDTAQMNKHVRELVAEALRAEGVEEIFTIGEEQAESIDIFDDEYMERVLKLKLPHTKIQLLQKLLGKAIGDFKKVNQLKGVDFSKRLQALIERYNERREGSDLRGDEFEPFVDEMFDGIIKEMTALMSEMVTELSSFEDLGIDMEEKAFLDILEYMRTKYEFEYEGDRLLKLAKEMKVTVDDVAQYPDWAARDDIKAKLKVDLILLLHKYGFPPIANDDVYKGVLEQAENIKANLS